MTSVDRQKLAASGLPVDMQVLIAQLASLANRPALRGDPGRGITSIIPNPVTGALTITLTDGTTAATGPLVGTSVAIRTAANAAEAATLSAAHPNDLIVVPVP